MPEPSWSKWSEEDEARWKESIRLTAEFDRAAEQKRWRTVWHANASYYVTDSDELIRWDSNDRKEVRLKVDSLPDEAKLKIFERRSEVLKDQKWDVEQKGIGWVAILGTALFFALLLLFQGGCQ